MRCKDGELKAKLYRNRSAAHFKLGEEFVRSFAFYIRFSVKKMELLFL